ncbi:MAG TPA: hypothetical protein VMI52_07570 [Acetobacteraceae bacterium]|nr:hypothetical protein [Acetobacteraceae bacterium]
MQTQDPIETAKALLQRHGLRARAVAQEHVAESQVQGDTAAFAHWESVARTLDELRQQEWPKPARH